MSSEDELTEPIKFGVRLFARTLSKKLDSETKPMRLSSSSDKKNTLSLMGLYLKTCL